MHYKILTLNSYREMREIYHVKATYLPRITTISLRRRGHKLIGSLRRKNNRSLFMNNPKYSAKNTARSTQQLTINNLKNLTNIANHHKNKNNPISQRVKRKDCRGITPTRFRKDGIAGRDK